MKISNNSKIVIIQLAFLFMGLNRVKAADPNWTVDAHSFQYNMTLMAVINIDCNDLLSAGNRIGVFVGNECRGTAYTNTAFGGKFLASLFIYSNATGGEALTFKIYDPIKDSIYEAKNILQFEQNASYGNASFPYVVHNKYPCLENENILPANNFISPNGDGKNDFFIIDDVTSYKDFALTIYNEFGIEVFKVSRDYMNNWDAGYHGKILPDGIYYYLFKNESIGKEYKGILHVQKSE